MKIVQIKNVTLAFLLLLTLGMAGQAQALTVAEVGALDILIGETELANSGDAEELAWIESIIGEEVFLLEKIEEPDIPSVLLTVDDGDPLTLATAIDQTTEYFLIKIGNVTTGDADTFLFDNLEKFEYAYFTLVDLNTTDLLKISHITTVIPVPAAAWLFGSALLGLVGVARRRA